MGQTKNMVVIKQEAIVKLIEEKYEPIIRQFEDIFVKENLDTIDCLALLCVFLGKAVGDHLEDEKILELKLHALSTRLMLTSLTSKIRESN